MGMFNHAVVGGRPSIVYVLHDPRKDHLGGRTYSNNNGETILWNRRPRGFLKLSSQARASPHKNTSSLSGIEATFTCESAIGSFLSRCQSSNAGARNAPDEYMS